MSSINIVLSITSHCMFMYAVLEIRIRNWSAIFKAGIFGASLSKPHIDEVVKKKYCIFVAVSLRTYSFPVDSWFVYRIFSNSSRMKHCHSYVCNSVTEYSQQSDRFLHCLPTEYSLIHHERNIVTRLFATVSWRIRNVPIDY